MVREVDRCTGCVCAPCPVDEIVRTRKALFMARFVFWLSCGFGRFDTDVGGVCVTNQYERAELIERSG
jgi:hypothetical protein